MRNLLEIIPQPITGTLWEISAGGKAQFDQYLRKRENPVQNSDTGLQD